ncbi:HDOD domain-containing protein [Candidatus Latescibacterota bacterium]
MLNFFKRRKKDPKAELEELFKDYELPSFPVAVMNVLTALRNPDFSMNKVSKILEGDPGLHVKVLKTVNSAAFGLTKRVSNIHHAVTLLGRSRLETIVLSQAVNKTLPEVDYPFFNMRQFWLTSARRASLARTLANHIHPATEVEAFTSGLLQDMALPILVTIKTREYEKIMQSWSSDKESDLTVFEQEHLGYDHSYVGALIAEKWDLPDYLINAIAGHHNSDEIQIEPAIELVSHIRGDTVEVTTEKLEDLCVEKFGMNKEMVIEMVRTAFEDAEELSKILR